jgi:hypothetical protein
MPTEFRDLAKIFQDACIGRVLSSRLRTAQKETTVELIVARQEEVDLVFLATLRKLRHPEIEIGCIAGLRHEPSDVVYKSCISGTAYEGPKHVTRGLLSFLGLTAMLWDLQECMPCNLSTSKILHRDAWHEASRYLRELAAFAVEKLPVICSQICSNESLVTSASGWGQSLISVHPRMKGAILACLGTRAQFEAWSTEYLERSRKELLERPGRKETDEEFRLADHAFVGCLRHKRDEAA